MAISPNISPKSCLGEIFSHISPFWFPLDFQLLLSFPYAISPRFWIRKNNFQFFINFPQVISPKFSDKEISPKPLSPKILKNWFPPNEKFPQKKKTIAPTSTQSSPTPKFMKKGSNSRITITFSMEIVFFSLSCF